METEIQNALTYFVIGVFVITLIGFYGFIMIDKLIKHMHDFYNEEWISAGKPSGMFYYPPQGKNMQSMISMRRNILVWVFKTPQWVKDDILSSLYLKKLRMSLAIANLSLLGLLIFLGATVLGLTK